MTTTTTYPRIPALPARGADEGAQAYGLRALLFLLSEGLPAVVLPDVETAAATLHASQSVIGAPDMAPAARERLSDLRHQLLRYLAAPQEAPQAPQAPAQPAGEDTPRQGPGAPLAPAPTRPTPPQAGRKAPQAPRPVVTGPAAIPARYTAISPALSARPVAVEELF